MRRGHYFAALGVGLLAGLLAACGGGSHVATGVTIAPSAATVVLDGTQQFSASVSGPSNTAVTWSITGTGCSGSACGTIDSTGLYTAPSALPNPSTVSVTATSQADTKASATAQVTIETGVQVTVAPASATLGTNETLQLTATVTGTSNTGVTWDVNGTVNGDSTGGLICTIGSSPCQPPATPVDTVYYAAPAAHPTSQITITATSVADTSRRGSVTFTVLAAVSPVVAALSPSSAAQGAVVQSVYLSAESPSNFFSTSTILANGQPVPTTFISTSLLRGEVPTAFLQAAGPVQIAVEEQDGSVSNSVALQVVPVRPDVISYSPVSVPECPSGSCGPASITLDGGYLSPSTLVQFNGQTVGATLNGANRIAVSLPGSSLQAAGLYQLTLTNPGASPGESAVNVAVAPDLSATPPSIVATATVGTSPAAVAIDRATGVAVVANTGSNTISLINLTACSGGSCPESAVAVGKRPTGVAVDPLRDIAIVVNQADNTLSLVNLLGGQVTSTIALPAGYVPVAIGENPLTGHATVANQETNTVTVVDLSKSPAVVTSVDVTQGGTRAGGTGMNPQVAIEPHLDWAIVTPGGIGAITAVDMGHPSFTTAGQPTYNVVFSFVLSSTTAGVALNPTTDQILLTDPNSSVLSVFSLLDESVKGITAAGFTDVAAALNPLTNVGLFVNQASNSVQAVDLTTTQLLGSALTVGASPVSVAIDAVTDEAVVVNQGDGTVSVVSLGAVRSPAIVDAGPARLFASSAPQQVTLIGGGFASGASVRIDGAALPSGDVQLANSRQIGVTIPPSFLAGPRMLHLDVQNTDGSLSNIFEVQVIQAVAVGTAPVAVAVDPTRNLAIVTNSGSNTVSLIDLTTGNVTATVNVGADPVAVDVSPFLGTAVIANNGDNTGSLLNLTTSPPSATTISLAVSGGLASGPIAVSINQDTGVAAVANQLSNSVSFVSASNGEFSSSTTVDQGPLAVAVDPNLKMAGVLCATQSPSTVDLINETYSPFLLTGHITGANLPTGIALDPVNDLFLVADSGGNRILVIDPQNNKITQNIATGINPASIAYNLQATEAVTINVASNTASVIEVNPNGSQVRDLLPLGGSTEQSVAIDPVTNIAVVADQANNRVLLVPLPH